MQFLKRYSYKTWLLCLFFFLLPWQTRVIFGETMLGGIASPFGTLSLSVTEALLIGGALVSFVRRRDRPAIDASYRVPIVLAAGVFCAAALSLITTDNLALSLNALLHLGSAMVLFLMLLDRQVVLKPILFAFGVGLVVPSLLGLWQVLFDSSPASTLFGLAERNAQTLGDSVTMKDGVRELRAYGSFSHPNVFGGYLAVGVLALRALLAEKLNAVYRKYLLAGMLLLTIALVLAASRSAILGLMLGIGLAALVSYMKDTAKARRLVIPIAFVVIAGALTMSFFVPNLVASLRGGGVTEDAAINERIAQYADYPSVMTQGPLPWLFGHGIGTYVLRLADVFPGRSGWDYQPIHNLPLLVLAEIGFIGLLATAAWASRIDKINFARFPNPDAVVAFAMGNVVLVILFFDHYLWSSWPGLALIAFVMALTVRMGEEKGSGLEM